MPNIKSAIKRVKVAERNRVKNRSWRTSIRSARTEVAASIGKKKEDSQTALSNAYKVIDMAVSKGILHKNAAARRKSSLAKTVNSTAASKKKK